MYTTPSIEGLNCGIVLRVLLLVLLVTMYGCAEEEPLPRPIYVLQGNFMLAVHTSVTPIGGCEFYFVIDANGAFTSYEFNTREETSSVTSGVVSPDEFAELQSRIREMRLFEITSDNFRVPPDSLIYYIDVLNGDRRRQLKFLPEDEKFTSFAKDIRSIMEKGVELEEKEALQAIRNLSDLGTRHAWSWVACVLRYRTSPQAKALLRELTDSGRANPAFRIYLEERDKR